MRRTRCETSSSRSAASCFQRTAAVGSPSFDPSFRSDPTALAIIGRAHVGQTLRVARLRRWLPPKPPRRTRRSPDEQAAITGSILDAIANEIRPFMPCRVFSDQHEPGQVEHGLAERGIHVTLRAWTAASKTTAFSSLRAVVNGARIELLDEPQALTELLRVQTQYKTASAGVITPRVGDSHSDMAIVLAGAVHELSSGLSGPLSTWRQSGDGGYGAAWKILDRPF